MRSEARGGLNNKVVQYTLVMVEALATIYRNGHNYEVVLSTRWSY